MNQIFDFAQVRADGKLMPSTLTVKEMLALGWEPSKVIALQWKCDGKDVEVTASGGIHGIVVPGSKFVAALYSGDEDYPQGSLAILSPNGSVSARIGNFILFSGEEFRGTYSWFEPAMRPQEDTFGVIFQTSHGASFRCDVNANDHSLTQVMKVQ